MRKLILTASTMALCLTTGQAFSAGFHLSEYTVTGLGRSFAGSGVVGDDFSAIGFNPAGMQYNATSGAQVGATAVSLHFDYKGSVGTAATVDKNGVPSAGARTGSGHTRPTRVLPHIFAQQKLNDHATLGIGVYVPFGLATDYDNGWFAGSHAGLSQLSATNVSPSLSYQITDTIALGGALNIEYIKAHLTGVVEQGGLYFDGSKTDVEGDDYGLGYTLGATYTPRKDIRLGASYRSKISHKLEGDLKVTGMPNQTYVPTPNGLTVVPTGSANGKSNVFAKVTLPEVVILSGAYDLNKCFTLSATAKWTRWSRFKSLDIYKTNGQLASSTKENWKNTWYYALGVDYRMNRNWTFRTGIGYDETVISSPEFRTTRIPDGRRVLTSLGASWKKDRWQIDAGYTHIFVHGGRAYGGPEGYSKADIKYSSDADLFSVGLQYKF